MKRLQLPEVIQKHIKGQPYSVDEVGLSGSSVILFEKSVLKIEKYNEQQDKTVEMIKWLNGKLPIPEVLEYVVENGFSYLLMTRIEGEMCCSPYYMEHSDEMVALMAEGLHRLWSIDISDCPRERNLKAEKEKAVRCILEGCLTQEDLSKFGFETAEEAAGWLKTYPVQYEPVLSHGDYCLPNLLLKDGEISGYIDIGGIGVADRYSDIVDCWNSLKNNFGGVFGGKVYEDFDPDVLFEKLNMKIDPVKFRCYRLIEAALS